MARPPGGNQHRLDFRRLDQCVPVGIHLGRQVQVAGDLGGLLQIDIGQGHDLTAQQGLAAAPDMVLADCPGPDYA